MMPARRVGPLDIDCPTCTAEVGEPCKVRKGRGNYRSARHFQAYAATRPLHQARLDEAEARRMNAHWFAPGRLPAPARRRWTWRNAARRLTGR